MRQKMKKLIVITFMVLVTATSLPAQQKDFPKLTGSYLGQKPPGETPELFAPGVISIDENFEHSAAVFSPDGKEVFWCTIVNGNTDKRVAGNLRLYTMKMVDGHWSAPRPTVRSIFPETTSPGMKHFLFRDGRMENFPSL